jgi:hypothetical protein
MLESKKNQKKRGKIRKGRFLTLARDKVMRVDRKYSRMRRKIHRKMKKVDERCNRTRL